MIPWGGRMLLSCPLLNPMVERRVERKQWSMTDSRGLQFQYFPISNESVRECHDVPWANWSAWWSFTPHTLCWFKNPLSAALAHKTAALAFYICGAMLPPGSMLYFFFIFFIKWDTHLIDKCYLRVVELKTNQWKCKKSGYMTHRGSILLQILGHMHMSRDSLSNEKCIHNHL